MPILFVSHEASASGAPFLILHFLRWLRQNTHLDFEVVLGRSGPLEPRFAELAPVAVFDRKNDSSAREVLELMMPYRAKRKLRNLALQRALKNNRFDLIYSNTIVNGELLENLPDQTCPLLSHVHELEYTIQRNTSVDTLAYTLRRTHRFIAGSHAVAHNLVEQHGVEQKQIDVVHDFIPLNCVAYAQSEQAALPLRTALGIPPDAFIVGAAGSLEWRKGYDLFIPLAQAVLRSEQQGPVHFVWVGGARDPRIPSQIAHDLNKLGLQKRVHFVGHQSNYLDYMAMFDAFCLTSREDPFPLVVLEAAALGKPLLCFAGSGGSPEFVDNDCGFVVPYRDVEAMASSLAKLIRDPTLCQALGMRSKAKVVERHDCAIIAPRILAIMQRLIATRSQ